MTLQKKFFNYAIPAVLSMWMFSLYTIVDGMFIAAGVGPMALASVNLAMPFINLILGTSLLFATGAAAYISILMGAGEVAKARQAYMTTFVTLAVVGLSITGFAYLFQDELVRFLGASENLHEYTKGYLITVVYFAVFQILAYFFEVMSRTDGYPKVATASVVIAGLFNVVLDYLFVMVFGWGVEGAAFATGLAQMASVVFLLVHQRCSKRTLTFVRFRYDPSVLVKSVPLGIADSITEFSVGIVVFLFNLRILQVIGEEGLVSYTLIAYVNTLVVMTMFGLSQGMLPLVGYHHGGGEWRIVDRLLGMGIKTAVVLSVVWFVVCQVFTGAFVSLFIDRAEDPELFSLAVSDFRLYAIAFLFVGVNVIMSTWFSAIERPKFGIAISLGRALVVAAVMLYAMSALFGPVGIWLSAAASELICLVISLSLHRRHSREVAALVPAT